MTRPWRFLKRNASRLVNKMTLHRLEGRSVLVFTMRRSGSTLLMKMIHSQPHVGYISQPHLHQADNRDRSLRIPKFPPDDRAEEEKYVRFFEELLAGEFGVWTPWKIWDDSFSFVVDRFVVKLFTFNTLIDWVKERFDVDAVFLVRHPIPVALSIMERDWEPRSGEYLRDSRFVDRYLSGPAERMGRRVEDEGSDFQRCVLEWCLENFYPLRRIIDMDCLVLTFEELLDRPGATSELICSRLDFPDPDRMQSVVSEPTSTAREGSRYDIRRRGADYLVRRWTDQVGRRRKKRTNELLEAFELDAYDAFDPLPHERLRHGASGHSPKGGRTP